MLAAAELQEPSSPLAPRWHTAALLILIVGVAVAGTLLAGAAPAAPVRSGGIVASYVPILVVQGALLFYVSRVGRSSNALPALLGRRWGNWRQACGDLAVAVATLIVIEAVEWAWARVGGSARAGNASALVPVTGAQRVAWVLVALTVAFCEEVVYRGYLQTQLSSFTHRLWLGVALQAFLFGIAHADQGFASATRIALYGWLFGVVAARRRSLLPCILAHGGIDLLAGLAP